MFACNGIAFMRSVLLAISLALPLPALATDWAPNMDISMPTLDDAFAIRRCGSNNTLKPQRVCYQQVVSRTFTPEVLFSPFTITRERTRDLNCRVFGRLPANPSLAQQVASTYCPDTTLLPAPFLR